MSTLWDALRKKDTATVKRLIDAKVVDVNEAGAGEQTPLHLACELNANECVGALLSAGATVGVEDGQLRTPLLLACESRAFECARLLIDASAPLGARDKNDMTPLHWLAAHGASTELLQLAVSKGADIDAVNFMMQTPLHQAVSKGHLSAATALVDLGAQLLVDDETKATVLHLATQHAGGSTKPEDSLSFVHKVLKAAKGKFDASKADREKRTALHWAAGNNAAGCVEALLEAKAAVDARDWGEHTPLHWACPMDAVESAKALLTAGADANAVDRDRRTALHGAAEQAAEGALGLLLEQPGIKVDAVDWGGYSPLHSAARRGAVGCIGMLIAKGGNPQLAALSGETPHDVATSADAKAALAPAPTPGGIKRRRSGTSTNLEGSLPELADALYDAISKKAKEAQLLELCDEKCGPKLAKWALGVSKGSLAVGTKHTSTRTQTVHTELTVGSGRSSTTVLHQLTFDDDGLIVGSVVYNAAK